MENYIYAMRGWSCFVSFCLCALKQTRSGRMSRPSATRTVKRGGGLKEGAPTLFFPLLLPLAFSTFFFPGSGFPCA